MGPQSYMGSFVHRNVVMRRLPVLNPPGVEINNDLMCPSAASVSSMQCARATTRVPTYRPSVFIVFE